MFLWLSGWQTAFFCSLSVSFSSVVVQVYFMAALYLYVIQCSLFTECKSLKGKTEEQRFKNFIIEC